MTRISLRCLTLLLLSLMTASAAFSQDIKIAKGLKITPTSRLLMDAGTFSDDDVELTGGVAVRDFRMGLKAYYDDFYLKADVSFAGNKVNLKDVYLQYSIGERLFVRAGNFSMPFGLQSAYGTAHKQFMAEPSSNAYQVGRRVGIMNSVWNNKLWLSYGIFADNKILTESTDKSGKQGFTFSGRSVYRPIADDGRLVQFGLSYAHTQAEANGKDSDGKENPRYFNYKSGYLTVIDKTNAVNAMVNDANNENKGTAEFAGIYKNFVLESQYYYSRISRNGNLEAFQSSGFYAVARGIILNKSDYKYSKVTAGINNPSNKALELAVGYSMLDLDDSKSNIYGGKMQDVSLGLSFYWNKYVTLRTQYSFIDVQTTGKPSNQVHALQCRVQYYF